MSNDSRSAAEAKRLEQLWSGEFGNAYIERNRTAGEHRAAFWAATLAAFPVQRILEVGCNLGGNLQHIASQLPPEQVYGIDINQQALLELHRLVPGVNALYSPARELPFRDRWFDLVFTMGVLIHQPETTLPLVMAEIVRCSRRYVLCGEYYAEQTTEISYRGEHAALFKRDYGRIYQELFPDLQLRQTGLLGRDEGWDDVTYWLFEKP
ncbi:pseudaminic acid biosynthesis-associated methylase [Candidatus Chloroploca sp. Khr17]|uniref:pseudaminic acid biosynthesis-associated methylase n=1 Tax=Candidatus Chloroploca sp. Khr17 TaxID=2496869 RepID=UPI0013EE2AB4|nr:pseudaminic acid biosynthesis-associated methylase [Candidatus Chloroploca sp. Khr17]